MQSLPGLKWTAAFIALVTHDFLVPKCKACGRCVFDRDGAFRVCRVFPKDVLFRSLHFYHPREISHKFLSHTAFFHSTKYKLASKPTHRALLESVVDFKMSFSLMKRTGQFS